MNPINVAILGATGTVGQKFITLLQGHPYFRIHEVVASPRSAGKPYAEAASWKQDIPIPQDVAPMVVKSLEDSLESTILFSGLDSSVAGEAETRFAKQGHFVISNSKNHRMDPDVPLIIPEINPEHFEIIKTQPYQGAIITNSNCSTMFLSMVLAPIHREFGIEAVQVTTMQAISGAGYPGVPSLDILGNVVPFIGGEEDKLETEPQKILGTYTNGTIIPADFHVSAQCNRVPVIDGHTETLSIKLKKKASPQQVAEVLASFSGMPQEHKLPTAPEHPIIVMSDENRPQPARDIWLQGGMATMVGRIRSCPVFDIKMVIMGHNTVRGAAGAAILNGEALVELGYLQ
ncbi:aspartate-semialdehyde dehydrogenase [Spirochaeta lutea]|uniref:aspartate-semialdehyde dehydrogenase n=1 Tax=Spirochaeta lutea TaxID=1480694 RepID=A0A098QS06_9SPIO|nr:aspartate-semialdehyde dehydrogenase [Spirochaeta lutea]KGE70650.1 aspartate-semialdehyde dehydrogenase [Spirochaeta lutea]